ncbi:MAG TPA: DUF29 domain-containing protein [Candidatus Tectomicrobia bacterium]|jgi:hypothetical protein
MTTKSQLYNQDFYAWTQAQAALLRKGAVQDLDLEHLLEEIEDMGHSQRDALASPLLVLLTHLLKLAVAARERPADLVQAGRGWRTTCRTQRRLLAKRLRRNPSLRPTVPEECAEAYVIASDEAATALDVDEAVMPAQCPWTPEQILDEDFWPEGEERSS